MYCCLVDVALAVVELLQELTDVNVVGGADDDEDDDDEEDEEKGAKILIEALVCD